MPLLFLRIATFVLGVFLAGSTLVSAVRTFVLPRSAPDRLTRLVFVAMRSLFNLRLRRAHTYADRDHVLELYAPLSLLALTLCALTTAPETPWSSDRAPEFRTPPLFFTLARRRGSGT